MSTIVTTPPDQNTKPSHPLPKPDLRSSGSSITESPDPYEQADRRRAENASARA
jgi:hypothetical protein